MIKAVLPGTRTRRAGRIINVTSMGGFITMPGRTDWARRSMIRAARSIADHDAVMDPLRAARRAKSGNQPGDPARAAQAMLELVEAEHPPVRRYLGADALKLVDEKIEAMRSEIAAWERTSRSTDRLQPA